MDDQNPLAPLLQDGVIDEVLGRLKSGKEADLWLVRRQGVVIAAKVYKDRDRRSFKNNAEYKEGREVRNSRTRRAIESGSRFGKEAEEQEWKSAEADALNLLHESGVRVPVPVVFYEGVLLMQLVVDAEGEPALRLIDVPNLDRTAVALYKDLRTQIVRMLCCDIIHGDLSAYNILAGADGPVIIDFPQIVAAAANSRAEWFFQRDFENVLQFFASFDRGLLQYRDDGRKIWNAYTRRDLTPDFVPSPPGVGVGSGAPRGQDRGPQRGPQQQGRGPGPGPQQGGRPPRNMPQPSWDKGPRPVPGQQPHRGPRPQNPNQGPNPGRGPNPNREPQSDRQPQPQPQRDRGPQPDRQPQRHREPQADRQPQSDRQPQPQPNPSPNPDRQPNPNQGRGRGPQRHREPRPQGQPQQDRGPRPPGQQQDRGPRPPGRPQGQPRGPRPDGRPPSGPSGQGQPGQTPRGPKPSKAPKGPKLPSWLPRGGGSRSGPPIAAHPDSKKPFRKRKRRF